MSDAPQTVTFDFHNTLARCDAWFELEISELLPAYLTWYARQTATAFDCEITTQAKAAYRRLRLEIMDHGKEVDAATCIEKVTRELGIVHPQATIEEGLRDVMLETLPEASPIDGVIAAVKSLKADGLTLGVVSSAAYHPFLEWTLEKFGIRDQFATVMTSARCGYYKSRPEIYSITLDELGAVPSSTVHVGDSHLYDVETAALLGIRTIWYNPDSSDVNGHKADAVVTSLNGVQASIFQLLNGRPA